MDLPLNILFDDDVNVVDIVQLGLDLAEGNHGEIIQQRPRIVRNENYFEVTIPTYSDVQFREHFRMSRQTFQVNKL